MSSEKIRLPVIVERTIADSRVARTSLAQTYEQTLRQQTKEAGVSITCHKKCSNCCTHPVMVSLLEGISIYRWLVQNHLWSSLLRDKLTEASSQVQSLSLDIWLLSAIPCVFLTDQGLCSIYSNRPFSCRVTYSVGDPYYCHPHRLEESTGILSKKPLFEVIERIEAPLLRQFGLSYFRIPLAKAVLYGEKIVTGELAIEDGEKALLP